MRLSQDDAVQTILLASFGVLRDSSIVVHHEEPAPEYPAVEQLQIAQHHPLAPECFKQMQMISAEGNIHVLPSPKPDFGGWFRFDPTLHENRDITNGGFDEAGFDMWPPRVLPMFKTYGASQLTYIAIDLCASIAVNVCMIG